MREDGAARQVMALVLVAVLMGLAVSVPLLDVGQTTDIAVSDGSGAPGSIEHDHALCMLYAAAPLAPSADAAAPVSQPVVREAAPGAFLGPVESGRFIPHRSRAPPSA